MDSTKRIIINTTAQYTKAIINIVLSLYSTRLIIRALGVSDYGVYMVVAMVVTMLGFMTNALVITTQRNISYYHGQGNHAYVKKIFTNSLFLHILFGLVVSAILMSLKWWLFDDILRIEPSRIETARQVYYATIFMLFTTIVTAPFKALFIARENIVYISVVEIFDGIIKLILAIILAYISADKLLVYAIMMALIQVINLLAYSIYGKIRFEECQLTIHRRDLDKTAMDKLINFAGWTIYGTGALAARSQGISIIFNHFMGTIVNGAYGIAAQVNNAIFFVSSSIVNAMNPQIMKAEGANDRQTVLKLAGQESKYSTALLSIASIPVLMELPDILAFWLDDVPEYTAMFCTFTLATGLCDQLTIGLNAVNQAQGRIGTYTMLMFTPKLLNLPIAWWLLHSGHSLQSVMWSIIIIESMVSITRLPFLKYTAGLNIGNYLHSTIMPLLPIIATLFLVSWGCTELFQFKFRFLLTIVLSASTGIAVAWKFSLNSTERQYIRNLVNNRFRK